MRIRITPDNGPSIIVSVEPGTLVCLEPEDGNDHPSKLRFSVDEWRGLAVLVDTLLNLTRKDPS